MTTMSLHDAYPINAAELARRHRINQRSLRSKLRAYPELVPGHRKNDRYEIDVESEKAILSHPAISRLPRQTP
jgi:hypothetical protein